MVRNEKRVYEPLRNEQNIEWHQNRINTIFNWFDVIVIAFISIIAIITAVLSYPEFRGVIFIIIVFTPVILILVWLHYDVPKKVGLFSNGIVFDYNGKYEYLYWLDVESYYEYTNPRFPAIIIKRDGSIKHLNLVDKEINTIIKRIMYEHFHRSR